MRYMNLIAIFFVLLIGCSSTRTANMPTPITIAKEPVQSTLSDSSVKPDQNQSVPPRNEPSVLASRSETIEGLDGAEMVLIPAGDFQIGGNENDDEKPIHTVYLDAFYIDRYEVTNAQYKKFVDATGYKTPAFWTDSKYNSSNQPVAGVNWEDAKAYAEWAGKRLPTEAEWEKAAYGGLTGKKYVWGDDWPPPNGAGNFDDETELDGTVIQGYTDGYAYTAPVGKFSPNGYGLYDMAGNVWEFCADWYSSIYYASSPAQNPTGPNSGTFHVLRGGSWFNSSQNYTRVAYRYFYSPATLNYLVGFRCAMDKQK